MKAISMINNKISNSGVTLTHLSKVTGLKVDTISKCAAGKRKLQADEFFLLATALGITPQDLFATDSEHTQ